MLTLMPALEDYVRGCTRPEPPLLAELRARTQATLPCPQMQVGPVEGALLHLLVKLTRARRVLEIGTFSGYSTICMATALPAGGRLVTCDIDARATDLARTFWTRAQVADRVELRLAPALDTLAALRGAGEAFDLVFVDADKESYSAYLDAALPMMPPGGLLVADNTLWSGHVLAPKTDAARAIAAFNLKLASDDRVEQVLLPVRDGVTLARKL